MDSSKASIEKKNCRLYVVGSRQGKENKDSRLYVVGSRLEKEEKFQPTSCNLQSTWNSRLEKEKYSQPTTCYLQSTKNSLLSTNNGVALVAALMISLSVMLLIVSTLYFVLHSTSISGAGKRYATASEAADGAVEVMKDTINLIIMGEPVSSLPIVDSSPPCLVDSVLNERTSCTTTLTLPGSSLFNDYNAQITVMRLYVSWLPGSRLEFARAGGGAPTTAVYFRINTIVKGPGSTRAETSALYRYVL
jgi:hypothetical protein